MHDKDYWMAYSLAYNHGVSHPAHVPGCPQCWNVARAEVIMEEVIDCSSPMTCRLDHDHLLGRPRPEAIMELMDILEEE